MTHPKYVLTAFDEVDTHTPSWGRAVADDEYAYLALVDGQSGSGKNAAAYRDLLRAVVGMTYNVDIDSSGVELFKVLPADALRVMSVFRLLGAADLLTVTLPERYWEIVDEHAGSVDQMNAAETIRWAEISGGALRNPAN